MKNEAKLQRLFAAARLTGEEPVEDMPEHLKRRILADWRIGSEIDDAWRAIVVVFRRGLVCASLVMLVALAWTYAASENIPMNDEALANFELRAQLLP